MDFGSSFVYEYDDSEEEFVSDDELQHGMTLSDSSNSDDEDKIAGKDDLSRVIPPPAFNSSGSSRYVPDPRYVPEPKRKKVKKVNHWRSAPIKTSAPGSSDVNLVKAEDESGARCIEMTDATPFGGTRSEAHQGHANSNKRGGRQNRYRRADTNVVSIKFNTLTTPGNMHTGDPVYCGRCQAVLSHLSHITSHQTQEGIKIWNCEFCGHRNDVDLMEEEIPRQDDITFMLEPALTTTASGKTGADKSLVIFCVDISGSMCVTTEVPGHVQLRGDRLEGLQSLNETRESQFLPRQRRDVTYISRLQGMQAAVDHQIGEMQKENPDRRVGLITFNNEVTVIGDGSVMPTHISGDRLQDRDGLIVTGKEQSLPQSVQISRQTLGDKVFALEEGGATALGPSLLLAVSMATQVPGSKVIICTDGMANVGLGSLDKLTAEATEEEQDAISLFYSDVSQLAVDNGVSVSVISIKGADCKMVELGKVADATGGQVNIVDPLKLTQEFGSILADPIIATKVTATFLLNKGLYFRHEDTVADNRVLRNVGNVTKETEITFEYGVKRNKGKHSTRPPVQEESTDAVPEGGAVAGPSISEGSRGNDSPKELPFQLQITYTDLDGARAMRLLTKAKPVTRDRNVAEKNMNISVLGTHTAQSSSRMAIQGEYTQSRQQMMMQQRLIARHTWENKGRRPEYAQFYKNIAPVEQILNQAQQRERTTKGLCYSDSDEEDSDNEVEMCDVALPAAKKKGKAKKKKVPTATLR